MKKYVSEKNFQPMLEYQKQGSHWQLAIPSPDHYYPLIYALGLSSAKEEVKIFNDKAAMGSITMTSFQFG